MSAVDRSRDPWFTSSVLGSYLNAKCQYYCIEGLEAPLGDDAASIGHFMTYEFTLCPTKFASTLNQQLTGAIRSLSENKVGHNVRISYRFRA